jgi:hypothetical protein
MRPGLRLQTIVVFRSVALILFLWSMLNGQSTGSVGAQVGAYQPHSAKGILVLYWYNKDHPWNIKFDQRLQEVFHRFRPSRNQGASASTSFAHHGSGSTCRGFGSVPVR